MLDLDRIEKLIRTEEDPEKLGRELKAMVEDVYPSAIAIRHSPFAIGEILPMHEFVARFKRAVCEGNETRFWQWPVRVEYDADGGLMVKLTEPIDLTEIES